MSIRGLDQRSDQPPAGWPTHEQTLWRLPWEDGLDEYMEWRDWREPPLKLRKTPQVVSSGVSASGVPDGTWPPVTPEPIPPESPGAPAASVSVVGASDGSHVRGA